MWYPYSFWSVTLWVAFPLSRIESFPSHTRTRILQCGEPASTSISHFIRVLFNCFLFRLLPFVGGWGEGRGGHRSLPHLSLSTASAIIDILADVASLLFTGGRNTGHRLPHVFWQQNRPLTQTQPSETNWTVDISLASAQATHINMSWRKHGLRASTRLQAVIWATNPDRVLNSSKGLDITMASGDNAGHSGQPGPSYCLVSSYASVYGAYTAPSRTCSLPALGGCWWACGCLLPSPKILFVCFSFGYK